MSHKGGRKSHSTTLAEEKEKRSSDTPVKEMKKKLAVNAEKEKQADKTEKNITASEKSDHTDKVPEKPHTEKTDSKKAHAAEKVDKNPTPDKNAQKPDKNTEKVNEKTVKNIEKVTEKTVKTAEKEKVAEKEKIFEKNDKKNDKVADKKVDKPVEKKNESEKKDEGKGEGKQDKPEKAKQNGGVDANGNADTVSDASSEEELVIDDQDELFPELTYDDTSDADWEEGAPSRSFTRRSQVKVTKTPETPRPASVKEDDSKEKVLKMNDSLATDRILRSADSPKREAKKLTETKKSQDSPKKDKVIDLTDEPIQENEKETHGKGTNDKGTNDKGVNDKEGNEKSEDVAGGKNKLEMDVVVEIEGIDESRCRTRARVSPYTSRLPTARHDQTTSSVTANYTGNNTTMEMDITETSSILEEPNLDDSSYLRGLRTIKGRSSYKPLKELALKHTLNRSTRSTTSANISLLETGRPTGTVVGRKRKPDEVELASEADESVREPTEELLYAHNKRMRLLDRFSVPFRGFNTRRAAEIVGINTDLPLTAPVASPAAFDPETLKPSLSDAAPSVLPAAAHDRDNKRCVVM